MNIKYHYDATQPRAQVWCSSNEITEQNDGSYTFNTPVPPAVGTGSEITVIDVPGLFLYYDADAEKAYNWIGGGK